MIYIYIRRYRYILLFWGGGSGKEGFIVWSSVALNEWSMRVSEVRKLLLRDGRGKSSHQSMYCYSVFFKMVATGLPDRLVRSCKGTLLRLCVSEAAIPGDGGGGGGGGTRPSLNFVRGDRLPPPRKVWKGIEKKVYSEYWLKTGTNF